MQYKGDDIPGFLGLQSGTQAPPGLYLGNVVWVYPTSTIKDNAGHAVTLPGSLTSTAEIILPVLRGLGASNGAQLLDKLAASPT